MPQDRRAELHATIKSVEWIKGSIGGVRGSASDIAPSPVGMDEMVSDVFLFLWTCLCSQTSTSIVHSAEVGTNEPTRGSEKGPAVLTPVIALENVASILLDQVYSSVYSLYATSKDSI
jgi:hypothetical protein